MLRRWHLWLGGLGTLELAVITMLFFNVYLLFVCLSRGALLGVRKLSSETANIAKTFGEKSTT